MEPKIQKQEIQIPVELAIRLLVLIQRRRKQIPIKNKMMTDISVRRILRGNKKEISEELFQITFKNEYKQIQDGIDPKWTEKRALKRFLQNIMEKMYLVQ
jgi:hypothetical protein